MIKYLLPAFLLLPCDFWAAAPQPYSSPVVTKATPGHKVDIKLDITGAKELILEVNDGGNGTSYDWADWIDPRITGPKGEVKVTKLLRIAPPKTGINKNQGGQPLKVNGQPYANGIGVHAASTLRIKLPEGYTTFLAQGGLDDGGTTQNGSTTSVQFVVRTDLSAPPPPPPPPPLDVTLLPGFEIERLYTVDLQTEGSWVALGLDHKNRLIASDRQGALYRITPHPVGCKTGKTQVERLKVDVGQANGILNAFGSLYVTGKGQGKSGIFRLTDTTGDDQYDKVEHLISLAVGSDHHAHALVLSPDGKRIVHLAGNNTDLPANIDLRMIQGQAEDHLLPRSTYYGHNTGRMAPGGFVLSFKPDGSDIWLHNSGHRNPYDFAYNHHGELFVYDADMEYDIGGPWYRPTRVVHAIDGAEFGWRYGAGKWPEYYPDTVAPVTDIGRGSPTGVTFGYGAKFPSKYQNALYLCDWTYGRMFAVHLQPVGSTYSATYEVFAQGQAMPMSDVVINPADGAMYFTVGGRRRPSFLYRIFYSGNEPTEASAPWDDDPALAKLRKTRNEMAMFLGAECECAIEDGWELLAHKDRLIRYTVRSNVSHRPLALWEKLYWNEQRPVAVIEGAVAMAKKATKEYAPKVLQKLDEIDFQKLELEQQTDLLRAYGLIFIRLDKPGETTRQHLIKTLSPNYPSGNTALDRELCQMLLYLEAPGAVEKSIGQLLASLSQPDQMFYAYHLRTTGKTWTDKDINGYFGWINRASKDGNYIGGGHFSNFIKTVTKETLDSLHRAGRESAQSLLKSAVPPPPPPPAPREFVKAWQASDFQDAFSPESRRSFRRGEALYNQLCSVCHLFNGKGGALGPDLTSVGGKLKPDGLVNEIINPSLVISEQHAAVMITLKDGTTLFGRETGGNDKEIQLATDITKPDQSQTISRSNIAKREVSKISLMPPGLINTLQKEEVEDLVTYLLTGGNRSHKSFQQ